MVGGAWHGRADLVGGDLAEVEAHFVDGRVELAAAEEAEFDDLAVDADGHVGVLVSERIQRYVIAISNRQKNYYNCYYYYYY